jgi:hypothetical protein
MSERRELYRSPNGDCWFIGREPRKYAARDSSELSSIARHHWLTSTNLCGWRAFHRGLPQRPLPAARADSILPPLSIKIR